MTIDLIEQWLTPGLWFAGAWSIRWGVLIGGLLIWFSIRAPQSASVRLLAARMTFYAGLLLPLVPVVWGPEIKSERVDAEVVAVARTQLEIPVRPIQRRPVRALVAPQEPEVSREAPARVVPPSAEVPENSTVAVEPLARPLEWQQIVGVVLAASWLLGVVIQLSKLLGGWFWLRRLCRESRPLSEVCLNEAAGVQKSLGVRRRVRLGTHVAVESPLLVPGWLPQILLPAGWEKFARESRVAALTHELAHLRRRDDVARIAEEIVRAVFFFHPLVHWLLARIDADREELCDAVVIQQGTAPRELARILLECCQLAGAGGSALPHRTVAVPLFRRNTVKDRIQNLMEEQGMSRWSVSVSPRRAIGLLTIAAALVGVIGSFGVRAEEQSKPQVTSPTPVAGKTSVPADPRPLILAEGRSKRPVPRPLLGVDPAIAKGIKFPNEIEVTTWIPESEGEHLAKGEPVNVPGIGPMSPASVVQSMLSGQPGFMRGRLVDVQGKPLRAHGRYRSPARVNLLTSNPHIRELGIDFDPHSAVLADSQGRFVIMAGFKGWKPGTMLQIGVTTATGQYLTASFVPVEKQIVDVFLPTHLNPQGGPPENVAKDELAGLVVDEQGRPIEGAHVSLQEGLTLELIQKLGTRTDKRGQFRIRGVPDLFPERDPNESRAPILISKPGHAPMRNMGQPIGGKGMVFVLAKQTWIEGTVRGIDGKPVPQALIRADSGPQEHYGHLFPEIWTETTTDDSGNYRLYVQPDEFELQVRTADRGVARMPRRIVQQGEKVRQDIQLHPATTFEATILDSVTRQPVPDVLVTNWHYPGIAARSDAAGRLSIPGLMPGVFEFAVQAKGYARWWSPEGKSEWSREYWSQLKSEPNSKWQENSNHLDFAIQGAKMSVTILVEREVRIRGRVVDPQGKPVPVAAVQLMGERRYLAGPQETQRDGTFELAAPASRFAHGELIAHTDYGFVTTTRPSGAAQIASTNFVRQPEARREWADGRTRLAKTIPGQVIEGVELRLRKSGTIKGKLVDADGRPLAKARVTAVSWDVHAWDSTPPDGDLTDAKGNFELKRIPPGKVHFGLKLPHIDAHYEIIQEVNVAEGQTVKDIQLRAPRIRTASTEGR